MTACRSACSPLTGGCWTRKSRSTGRDWLAARADLVVAGGWRLLDAVAPGLQTRGKGVVVGGGPLLLARLLLLSLPTGIAVGAALPGTACLGTELGATFHSLVGAVLRDVARHLSDRGAANRAGGPLTCLPRGSCRRRRSGGRVVAGLARGLGGALLLVGGYLVRGLARQGNDRSGVGHASPSGEQAPQDGSDGRPEKRLAADFVGADGQHAWSPSAAPRARGVARSGRGTSGPLVVRPDSMRPRIGCKVGALCRTRDRSPVGCRYVHATRQANRASRFARVHSGLIGKVGAIGPERALARPSPAGGR